LAMLVLRSALTPDGIGIDLGKIEEVFSAFHTTKPGRLGMGLSISRSIVGKHSGRLWATANEVPGASFHFTLLAEPLPSLGGSAQPVGD
jgi:signal transduction histidine kinase